MNIAFDVDGVVLRSIEVILETINAKEGRTLTADDLSSWDLEPLGLSPLTLKEAVDRMYSEPRIEPYEGAVQALSKIYQETRRPLLFITGRPDPRTAQKHLEALDWNPTVPEMIVVGGNRDKRDYLRARQVDFMIEDDPKHLLDYLSIGLGVGLMLQPWNRHLPLPVSERFQGWRDVERWFRRRFSQQQAD
ncbi:MAG: 5' nucleotidase, NT5C type [Desulfomonilaceae bacterium]